MLVEGTQGGHTLLTIFFVNCYYNCFFPGAWVHATIQRISKYYIFQVLTFYDWNFLLKFRLSTV